MSNHIIRGRGLWLTVSIWSLLFATVSCVNKSSLSLDSSSAAGAKFSISGSGSPTAGFCTSYTINVVNASGSASALSADTTVALSGGNAKFYSGSSCSGSPITSLLLPSGSSSAVISARDAVSETYTITVSGGNLTDGALSVTTSPIAADLVLGAPDFTTNKGLLYGINAPDDIFSDGTHVFAADGNNNRILIWNSIPTSAQTAPDVILGQPDHTTIDANHGGISAKSIYNPEGIWSDGTKLYVADTGNNRVLIWNSIPTQNFAAADIVVGQPNFTSNTANNGGISASTFSNPYNLTAIGGRLIVADAGNARVLIWNTIPTSNGAAASHVLGQPDFVTATFNYPSGTPTQSNFNQQLRGVTSDGTSIWVADYLNHRVLRWSTIPNVDNAPADLVLGQADYTHNSANAGGAISAVGFNQPTHIYTDGTRLYLADYNNNRVLIWSSLPTANAQAADVVVGQTSMTSGTANAGGIGASTLWRPYSVSVAGTHLFVSDYANNRFLIYNAIPSANGASADVVLGQPNFVDTNADNSGAGTNGFQAPRGVFSDGSRLFVADYLNWRTLIWNLLPSVSNTAADVVLGQPDFNTTVLGYPSGSTTASNSKKSNNVFVAGTRLYEADHDNNRILVWNSIPTANNTPGDFALGQPDLVTGGQNTGGISATSMKRPEGVMQDSSGRVIVADSENNRVLIWNSTPNASGTAADLVIGKTAFNDASYGCTASLTGFVENAWSVGNKLIVGDANNRILIWNTFPTTSGQAADLVLGQPDFVSSTANNGGIGANTLYTTAQVWSDGTRLVATDTGNNRVLVWLTFPTSSGTPADLVIGQKDFVSNSTGTSATTLWSPRALNVVGNTLWVIDSGNNRVLRYQLPPN